MFTNGLVSVSFRSNLPKEICSAASAAGLGLIEWGSDVHARPNDKSRLAEIANLQNSHGIACSSYGSYFRSGTDDLDTLKGYIDAAHILGTNVIRIWCGDRSCDKYAKGERESLISDCIAAAEIARGEGVTLCTECHRNSYTETKEGLLDLMKCVNSTSFLTYWQPNQFRSVEENLEYAKLAAPYTVKIHVFNWKRDDRLPLERAIETWQQYLACFDGSQDLLLEFMPHGTIAELPREAHALRVICEKFTIGGSI